MSNHVYVAGVWLKLGCKECSAPHHVPSPTCMWCERASEVSAQRAELDASLPVRNGIVDHTRINRQYAGR